ncbi:MAG: hypothetical protein Kow00117_14000 [Phototrophicales bacterium]|nr:MAG: hypothetical protein CUN56_04980 [Phototrophicales bacterium]RMG74514.1 MAG: hypothetical protein D6711_08725 [Chloroflexota bacterium]
MEILRRLTVTQAIILVIVVIVLLIVGVLTFNRGDNESVDFTQITPTAIIDFSNVAETTQQFVPVSTIDPLGGN